MKSIQKFQVSLFIATLIASIAIAAPAKAFDEVNFEVWPNHPQAGQAIVIGVEVTDCLEAPTSAEINIKNSGYEKSFTNTHSSFESTFENSVYRASWTYSGQKGKGLRVGKILAVGNFSGGCVGSDLEDFYYSALIPNAKGTNLVGDLGGVAVYPDTEGMVAYWPLVFGATSYQVAYSLYEEYDWQIAGTTKKTSYELNATELGLVYGQEYQVRVRPKYGKLFGDWQTSYSDTGFVTKVSAWTSVVGDETSEPTTEFNSSSDIQFNFLFEDCGNFNTLTSPETYVHTIWNGSQSGQQSSEYFSINKYGNSEEFTDFNSEISGDDLLVTWQTSMNLNTDTYVWGSYFLGYDGCTSDGFDEVEVGNFPFSEYQSFSITDAGKKRPIFGDSDYIVKSEQNQITVKWAAPENSEDGPFTYRIYNTFWSQEESDWELIRTTSKRQIVIKNLRPDDYLALVVVASNAAGSNERFTFVETSSISVKKNSEIKKATLIKTMKYPKSVANTIKITAADLYGAKNSCVIKKNSIKFSKSIGVCAIEISGEDSRGDFQTTKYLWSVNQIQQP